MKNKPIVSFVTLILSHYRIPFHRRVRDILAKEGVEYRLVYSDPAGSAAAKGDTVDLPWATKVPVTRVPVLGNEVFWQNATNASRDADLTIVSQENKLLFNYWLLARWMAFSKRFAFFGHGKNFQSRNPNGWREKLKRALATRVHWWFAYTPGVRKIVKDLGFPADRITVNYNAIDTGGLRADLDAVTDADIAEAKHELGIRSDNIAIYIGGMYQEKRLPFLIAAAEEIRKQVPDFQLLLVGSGSQAGFAEIAASQRGYIHFLGPRFGHQKATLLKMSKLFLMPGLVGLAVMDSFAAGCPLVTTDVSYHSPEIEYLSNGDNGVMVENADDPSVYAGVVANLLKDDKKLQRLSAMARATSEHYSIERMAEHFSEGVLAALAHPVGAGNPEVAGHVNKIASRQD